jgi:hypothetical protein
MVADEVFVNCSNFNPITYVNVPIFKISLKTIRSRSRSADLRLRGAERNIYFRLHNTEINDCLFSSVPHLP